MKKMNFKLLAMIISALVLVFISSCKKDDDEPTVDYTPVLNSNFHFTVNGNNVVFTTTISGNVWFTLDGVDYPTIDKTVTVFLATAGTYSFTCSTLGSGVTETSDPFDVVVTQNDLSFLDKGVWKLLTGGQGQSKTWVLDIDAEGSVTNLWFAPVAYSGTADDPYFYWDYIPTDSTDVSYLNWSPKYNENTWLMPALDYGTMTFHANDQTVTTVRPNEMITSETGTVAIDTTTMLMTLTGTVIPRDSGRTTDVEDWQHYRIYKLTENSMSLGVKRVLDGGNPGPWVVLYNFVTKKYKDAYVPPPPVEFVQPVLTSFTKDDLVGTWVYDTIPFDWIGWELSNLLNNFTSPEAIVATGWAATQEQLDAAATQEFVFNSDGSCTLNGVTNTYTVSEGKITFGTELGATDLAINYVALTGTEVYAIDLKVPETHEGIWIGQQNDVKKESKSLHLVKKP